MKREQLRYDVYVSTDKGNIRENNEDNFAVNAVIRPRGNQSRHLKFRKCVQPLLCAVFDGMGGESCGKEASEIAARMSTEFYQYLLDYDAEIGEEIYNYVEGCNRAITKKLKSVNALRGGSTFVMAYCDAGEIQLFSLGDSRIYLYTNSVLRQISVDHTLAMKKYLANIYTREEAETSKDRHKLTDFLGNTGDNKKVRVESYERVTLKEGDMLLMCSDGLYDMCSDDEIASVLSDFPKTATIELVESALKNGGKDNVTCMIIACAKNE